MEGRGRGCFRVGLLALGLMAGISVAADAQRMDPRPIGNPATWIGPDDYPPEAIRAKQEGRVAVSVAVDAAGTATGCTVDTSSNFASLDARTCELLMQPAHRFYPARDEKGQAVAGVFRRQVIWMLPVDDGTMGPIKTGGATFRMIVDAAGVVTGCEAIAVPAGLSIDANSFCARMGRPVRHAVSNVTARNDPRRMAVQVLTDRLTGNDAPVTGEIPGDMTLFQKLEVRYVVRPDGSPQDCFRVIIFGPPSTGPMPCEFPARYAPADTDRPVREIQRIAYRYLQP